MGVSPGWMGPVGQVRIVKISTEFDGTEEVFLSAPKNPWLTSITITIGYGTLPSIQVGIDMPYREGIDALDNGLFGFMNYVEARIGYSDAGIYTPWYSGFLFQGSAGLTLTAEGFSGTIEVSPGTSDIWRTQEGSISVDGSITARESLDIVTKAVGWDLVLSPDAERRLEEFKKEYVFAGKSYHEVISAVMVDSGCFHSLYPKTGRPELRVNTRVGHSNEPQSNYYVLRGGFSPEKNEYPLMSISPQDEGIIGSGVENTARGVTVLTTNQETQKVIKEEVKPEESEEKLSGEVDDSPSPQDVGPVKGSQAETSVKSGEVNEVVTNIDQSYSARLQAHARQERARHGYTATLNVLGNPSQNVGELVVVSGCSNRYNGAYSVTSVEHTWSAGSYETVLGVQYKGIAASQAIPGATETAGGRIKTAEAEDQVPR